MTTVGIGRERKTKIKRKVWRLRYSGRVGGESGWPRSVGGTSDLEINHLAAANILVYRVFALPLRLVCSSTWF